VRLVEGAGSRIEGYVRPYMVIMGVSWKVVAASVPGKSGDQCQKRITVLRRRDATRYAVRPCLPLDGRRINSTPSW
jgi:hypothetical protein